MQTTLHNGVAVRSLERSSASFSSFVWKSLIVLFLIWNGAVFGQVSENFQSWTSQASYGNYTQAGSGGTWTMTNCIVANNAIANGTGSIGRVQMSSTAVLQLPTVASVGIIEARISAGAAGRTVKLQYYNGSSWVDLVTWTGIGTTGATYSYTYNNASSSQLRLSSASSTIYIHDMSTTTYSSTPCSGAPTAGTVSVTPTSDGPSTSYTVSATGYSTGASGLSYQWQSNTNGGGWTNAGSSTSSYANYNATAPATAGSTVDWRLKVTCSASAISTDSATATFTVASIWNVPATGNNSISTCNGTLYDSGGASGNYVSSSSGYTVINPSIPGNLIRLSGSITAEGGYDYLTIYDGSGTSGTILWGGIIHGSGTSCVTFAVPVVTSTTGALTVKFFSDSSTNCTGFALNISCIAPSASPSLAITGTTAHGSTCPTVAATSQTYTITNTGASIAAGVTVVSNDTQFVVSGLSSTSIAASGGTATYTVTFTPATAGAKTATITVASTTSGSNSPTSALTGTGITPVTAIAVTAAASNIATTTVTLNATSATTFGVCATTTEKGFVIAPTASSPTPVVGGAGVTKEVITPLGTTGVAYSKALTGLTASTGYSYRAYLYNGSTYTYGSVITFSTNATLANDDCSNAIALTINAVATSGTVVGATASASPFDSYKDVWYKFVPTCTVLHTIEVTGYSGDMDLYIYNQSSACPTTTTNVGYSGFNDPTEFITNTFTTGVTYYIRIRAYDITAETSVFTVAVRGIAPAQPASITAGSALCVGSTVTFTAPTNVNATTYNWTLPPGWTGSSTTNTIDAVVGASGSISVSATNCYGTSALRTLAFSSVITPATPDTISGTATVCSGTANTYSIAAVNSATSYIWTLPLGWTGTSTTNSINATANGGSGTITVKATNACGTSAAQTLAVSVNPIPVAPGTPTSNSPQCTPTGVTITQNVAGAPAGETWFWQTAANGVLETNSGLTYTASTSGTYYIRSKNTTTGCWSAATSIAVVVNATISTLATVPSPTNSNTAVCYSGTGATTAISWTAATGATSYDVYFGVGSVPLTVTANVTTTNYTVALAASTNYFWKIVPKNNCGETSGTVVSWNFTTQASICYCAPTYSSGPGTADRIVNVSLGTLSNTTAGSNSPYYTFYNAVTVPTITASVTEVVSVTYGSDSSQYGAVWIDFNRNGQFETSEGTVSTVNAGANGTSTFTIIVPFDAILGQTRMRVRGGNDSALTTSQACGASSSAFGETEDYIVNIVASCTPAADPTGTITGTFNACSNTSIFYNGADAATAYWQTSSTGISTSDPVVNATTAKNISSTGTYYVRKYNGNCWSTNAVSQVVTVNNIPTINSQPVNASIVFPAAGTFNVVATGGSLAYQWKISVDCGANWNDVSTGTGGTTASYTTGATSAGMSGNLYKVIVTNSCGTTSSNLVSLIVSNEYVSLASTVNAANNWTTQAYATASWTATNAWSGGYVNVNVSGSDRIQFQPIVGGNAGFVVSPVIANPLSIKIYTRNSSSSVNAGNILKLSYSLDGSSWTFLEDRTINNTYSNVTFDVSALSLNSDVYFRFERAAGAGSSNIYVDSFEFKSSTPPADVAAYTWTGNGNNNLWTTPCNWSPKGVPGADDSVIFNTNPSDVLTITQTRTVNNFTLNGTGNFKISSTGTLTINGDITYGGTATATLDCGSTVNIKSTSSQVIPPLNYGNLDALGGNRTFSPTGTIGICAGFNVNPALYTYTVTGSTINYFSSTTGWVMSPFTYNNLTFSGLGDFSIGYSSPAVNKTITVLGDYVQTAGTVYIGETTSATGTLNVEGNVTLTGGTLNVNQTSGGTGNLNIKGDLVVNSGATLAATAATTANVNFNGTGNGLTEGTTQTIANAGTGTAKNARINFTVKNGAYAKLISSNFNLGTGSKWTVENGATTDFGMDNATALNITGPTFESQAGSTLKITAANGITTSGTTGNVQTTVRTFATTTPFANFHYIGNANQTTGNALPSTVAELLIGNTGTIGNNQVTLDNSITVRANLIVSQGILNLNSKLTQGSAAIINLKDNATLKIMGTDTFPTGFTTHTIASNSIVDYAGTDQNIVSLISTEGYGKLKVSGTGTKLLGSTEIKVGNALEVSNSGLLSIEQDKTLTVVNEITTVDNAISVQDGGSLVQVANVNNASGNLNIGKISVARTTKPMNKLDYTYWSAPVSGNTLISLSPETPANKFFSWNAGTGAWSVVTGGAQSMSPGKGYIVRAPNSYTVDAYQNYNANFSGVPNNGTVNVGIVGSATVEKWNLIGNPYPSAINANAFLAANAGGSNNILGGTLYFWTHNTPYGPTTYAYSVGDYAAWNGSGQTATNTGGLNDTDTAPDGNIAAGQGFFVQGTAAGTAVFNNTMRVNGNNMKFFKTNPAETENNVNASAVALTDVKHRVWLNLKGATQGFSQSLVGYISNATNGYDNTYDGPSFGGNAVTLYSILEAKKLTIQGRALPFVNTDEVPMGYKTTLTGNLTISIDHVDGLMEDQDIYLKDNVLNTVHNLKVSDYTFATIPGTFNDRFVLRYLPAVELANPTFEDQIKEVTIRKNDAVLRVNSPYETIEAVMVYDIMGRLVFEQKDCNTNTFEVSTIVYSDQTLIVKVRLSNGGVVTKKVL